jgi:hypothetical protein
MGLSNFFLDELIQLKERGAIEQASRVLEIGAQQLSDVFLQKRDTLHHLYQLFGRTSCDLGLPLSVLGGGITDASPSSRQFWESLGFRYASVEYGGLRDSIALDLNHDNAPDDMRNAFDLVVNAGTTEHVANQENAFRLVHDCVIPGGVMMHEVPCAGFLNHGFVSYAPNFFFRLCKFNDYFPLSIKIRSWRESPVPQDLRTSNIQFGGGIDYIEVETVTDFLILASLRKQHDKPFVTPLDAPLGD